MGEDVFYQPIKSYYCTNVLSILMYPDFDLNGWMAIFLEAHSWSAYMSVVDRGFNPWLVQTRDCKIYICCSSAKYTPFRSIRSKTAGHGIEKKCPSGADCCFSGLEL